MGVQFKEIDDKKLKKLQKVQIEILDEIDRICKKNNIEYILTAGTLLGAVRHKNFIPWDDDLDVAMLRSDYEKFIEVCYKDLDNKYFLDCPKTNSKCFINFAKIRKNNTTFDEEFVSSIDDMHKGIFVDIFPLDVVSSNFKVSFVKGFFIKNLVDTILYKKHLYKIDDCRHPLFVKFFSCLSIKKMIDFCDKIATSYKGKNKTHIVSFYGGYSLKKEFMGYDVIFPTKLVSFNGKKYPGPNNADKYLTIYYQDYMQLPPVEERVNHSALNISFDEGVNMILEKKNED